MGINIRDFFQQWFSVDSGIHQGSILGPNLFLTITRLPECYGVTYLSSDSEVVTLRSYMCHSELGLGRRLGLGYQTDVSRFLDICDGTLNLTLSYTK